MPVLPRVLSLCLCAIMGAACHAPKGELDDAPLDLAQEDAPPSPLPDAGTLPEPQPPVACGSMLPGPPLKADVTEALPGYAEELAAIDLAQVPDPFDYSAESKLTASVINYMLGRSEGRSIAHKDALQKGGIGRAVLGAAGKGTVGRIDFAFLRRGLYYFYLCSRPLPGDLTELRRRYGDYRAWPVSELPCSRPKNSPRRLYESPELGVYVAETLANGQVRETEVLFTSLRTDGQIDFAAYNAEGSLSDRSTFATSSSSITTAAPYTCISCHLDSANGSITRRIPTGTGAGCR